MPSPIAEAAPLVGHPTLSRQLARNQLAYIPEVLLCSCSPLCLSSLLILLGSSGFAWIAGVRILVVPAKWQIREKHLEMHHVLLSTNSCSRHQYQKPFSAVSACQTSDDTRMDTRERLYLKCIYFFLENSTHDRLTGRVHSESFDDYYGAHKYFSIVFV